MRAVREGTTVAPDPDRVPEHRDDIDDVIHELVEQDAVATIMVPEQERANRRPSANELARPDGGPSVLVDDSLWEADRPVGITLREDGIARGTMPPPAGPYCIYEPPPPTEPVEVVAGEIDHDDSYDELMVEGGSVGDDAVVTIELDDELALALDDL